MLYAFDGTWNMDKPGSEHDTNVLKFKEAYQGPAHYATGVGTRFSLVGEAVGGITGAGGRTRVSEAYDSIKLTLPNDPVIDIVGFSRGAALALHFANKVAAHPGSPRIRFLGLWDCVPSFGVASVDVNLGWDLDLPDNVEKCYHALSLDERRNTFHLHRLDAAVDDVAQEGRLFELWFRGVHSDIGGGNDNPGLSSIALNWMLKKAAARGLPIDPRAIVANVARMHPGCAVSSGPWYDLVKDRRRAVRWNDQVHTSVAFAADCNNPPAGAVLVDDMGVEVGRFERVVARV